MYTTHARYNACNSKLDNVNAHYQDVSLEEN